MSAYADSSSLLSLYSVDKISDLKFKIQDFGFRIVQ
jgi:hypothetical protein